MTPEPDQLPGPGHYTVNDGLGDLRSQLGFISPTHLHESSGNVNPGPGSYDPELSAVKDRAPLGKIAKSKRDFLTGSVSGSQLPGPGHYDIDANNIANDGHSFTIG